MNQFKQRLIHLQHCRGIGWKSIFHILKTDPQLKSIYNLKPNNESIPLISTSVKPFFEDLHSHSILEQISHYSINDIHVISYFDDLYPPLLKEIYQPPWLLFVKGNIDLLSKEPKLAVVGSRQATEYGKKSIEFLFPKLIERGIIIVSGLATGIDTLAHKTTIRLRGETIGVIAGGFYHIYPKENKELALEMMKHHLLVSEYSPNTKPSRWHFPMRNRIISGLSRGTLVVEAKRKSGSLITASYALNEGREVFAIPGNITNLHSDGTNDLIQQGAKLVKRDEDILEEFLY